MDVKIENAPSCERLHELLDYNPKTGVFVWKVGRQGVAGVGTVAGSLNNKGYRTIGFDGWVYLAHRLAWLYFYGYNPENSLDHINRDKDDNRISNLREVSNQCNMRNSNQFCTNTSGVRGVFWLARRERWRAHIKLNQRSITIGEYKSFDEAVCSRLAAEQCLDWSGCDSTSDAYLYVQKNIIRRNC